MTGKGAFIQGATVPGARRRVRALMARAWPPGEIARRSDVREARLERLLRHGTATAEEARKIARAYELLWARQPPLDTPEKRDAASEALQRAQRASWPPPLAWDDDALDDPDGEPAPGWKPRRSTQHRAADIAEDAAFVRQHGGYKDATNAQVAMRLGVSRSQLEHACGRAAASAPGRAA